MGYNIYKIEQLRIGGKSVDIEVINKRAKAKYSQEPLMEEMRKLDSPLRSKYDDTYFCGSVITQKGKFITSRYCKNRWCKVCNRHRTGKLIAGYEEPINLMEDKQFVTLTIPNVKGDMLRSTIKKMISTIQKIQDKRRKTKQLLIRGIRKLECTFNPRRLDFHPHFHFILDGVEMAQELIKEWLNYYPEARPEGQHYTFADKPIELFKYFTKLTSKTSQEYCNGTKLNDEYAYPEALDIIFRSIEKLRIVQPMGGITAISDDIDEYITEEADETLIDKSSIAKEIFIWMDDNWINPYTGECFSSFKPMKNLKFYRKKIRYLEQKIPFIKKKNINFVI
jgi:hypothetical protein